MQRDRKDGRHERCHKQCFHELLCQHAIEHQYDRWRYQHAKGAAGGDGAGGQFFRVVPRHHFRQGNARHGRCRGNRRAAHGPEPGASADGCQCQPPFDVADQGIGDAIKITGQAADGGKGPHQQKQGNHRKLGARHLADGLGAKQCHGRTEVTANDAKGQDTGDPHGDAYGNLNEYHEQHKAHSQQSNDVGFHYLLTPRFCAFAPDKLRQDDKKLHGHTHPETDARSPPPGPYRDVQNH